MASVRSWLKAFRLRTLPLSIAGIIVGNSLANYFGHSDTLLFVLALVTVLLLQILSNLANDLGDSLKGTDNDERVGPKRTVQSGEISKKQMITAVVLTSTLALISAVYLAYLGTKGMPTSVLYIFLTLALACVVSAITYTIGRKAYGYMGLGDIFVFLFFGIISVCGIYVLIAKEWNSLILLPAIAVGLLSSGVLNLNNLRDIVNDAKAGKNTLVVKMGSSNGKIYHAFLILAPALAMSLFSFLTKDIGFLFSLLIYIVLFPHLMYVFKEKEPQKLDSELKKVALSTFFMSLIICVWSFIW